MTHEVEGGNKKDQEVMLPRDEETSKSLIDGIVNQYGRKEMFSIHKKPLQMDNSSSRSWTLTRINTLPVQNNDHDCGAFVCMLFEFMQGTTKRAVAKFDWRKREDQMLKQYRERIAYGILVVRLKVTRYARNLCVTDLSEEN